MNLRDAYFHIASKTLKVGDRIELLTMPEDPNPVPEGTQGTVESMTVDSCDTAEYIIGVKWDNGRTLNVCTGVDRVMKVNE